MASGHVAEPASGGVAVQDDVARQHGQAIAMDFPAGARVVGTFFGWTLVRALRRQGITESVLPVGSLPVFVVPGAVAGILPEAFPGRRAAEIDMLRAIAAQESPAASARMGRSVRAKGSAGREVHSRPSPRRRDP
jgi:hypothetical protein